MPVPPASRRPLVLVTTTTAADGAGPRRARLNAAYVEALEGAGLLPLLLPPLADPGDIPALLDVVQGLVLTGGEDVDPARYGASAHPTLGAVQPARDATEIALVAAARERRLPTLAICRGMQLLNVALGGTLVQDLPSERPGPVDHDPARPRDARVHAVAAVEGTRLAAGAGARALRTNSFHHQAVDRLAPPLRATGHAPDGVVEAVETAPGDPWWVLGVQWHPEELVRSAEDWDRALFAAFARRAGG